MSVFAHRSGRYGQRKLKRMRSFLDFIASSPSSFHAAHQVARRLDQAGFAEQDEAEPWDASPGGHYVVRGGAIMAWWVPENASPESGFRTWVLTRIHLVLRSSQARISPL